MANKLANSLTSTAVPYVDVHETHTGIVLLVGDRAFKAKKPVLTDFLDFRTSEERERACFREFKLNSRLSPDSYLGVAHLTDPTGAPAEPVVVMRRYRDEDRLTAIVTHEQPGQSAQGVLDRIANMLARFHEQAERDQVINEQGKPSAIVQRWHENLTELNRYATTSSSGISDRSLSRIQHLVTQFTSGRAALLNSRVDEGCIVDGHADLLADDIFCVGDEPALLDCLEFDDKLRYVDRIDDAAFLAMDLEFLGRKDLGDYFLEQYVADSADTAPPSLRDFYIGYRAVVRAKVDCMRVVQGRSESKADAATHLDIALQHLENGAVRLALVGGNPGTGKSTLAHALAESSDTSHLDGRRAPRITRIGRYQRRYRCAGRGALRLGQCRDRLRGGPAPGAGASERGAISDSRRHLARSAFALTGLPRCRGNPFGPGGPDVRGSNGHGSSEDQGTAGRQL
jgi:aminoglycoside phosphotransferase family enzyme